MRERSMSSALETPRVVGGTDYEPADAEAVNAGLDALEEQTEVRTPLVKRLGRSVLPPVLALAVVIGVWQWAFAMKFKPDYVLPSPATVFGTLGDLFASGRAFEVVWTSLSRGIVGFAMSVVIGTVLGLAIARTRWLRASVGPLLTGLQSLPSVAWAPPALLLFGLTNTTYYAVVLLGAVPSMANGLISGADQVPPLYTRVGQVLGLGRWGYIRHILLPGALPGYLGGLRQGWAFAWRSLMAAELIVTTSKLGFGLGQLMDQGRALSEMDLMLAAIILIFVIGVGIEVLFFRPLERSVLRSRGLRPAGSR
jgi:NitT/TauT family transport system permease protein